MISPVVRLITFIVALTALSAFAIFKWNSGVTDKKPIPDPQRYETLINSLNQHRADLRYRYQNARNAAEQDLVLHDAHFLFTSTLPHLMECWIGTEWDYNGMAKKPGEGKIACGYFVTTILQDAGLTLNRQELAQAPSETLIRTLIPSQDIRLSSNQDYQSFLRKIDKMGHGIFIIGLDTHVGFIVNSAEGWSFIHASRYSPNTVTSQKQEEANAIIDSQYRVCGKLAADPSFLSNWLKLNN